MKVRQPHLFTSGPPIQSVGNGSQIPRSARGPHLYSRSIHCLLNSLWNCEFSPCPTVVRLWLHQEVDMAAAAATARMQWIYVRNVPGASACVSRFTACSWLAELQLAPKQWQLLFMDSKPVNQRRSARLLVKELNMHADADS